MNTNENYGFMGEEVENDDIENEDDEIPSELDIQDDDDVKDDKLISDSQPKENKDDE